MKANTLFSVLLIQLGLPQFAIATDATTFGVPTFGAEIIDLIDENKIGELTKLLDRGLSPNSFVIAPGRISRRYSLIEYACLTQNDQCIDLLVSNGADVKARTSTGAFPIETLIANGRHDLSAKLSIPTKMKPDEIVFEFIIWDYWLRRQITALDTVAASQIQLNNHPVSVELQLMLTRGGNIDQKHKSNVRFNFQLAFKGINKDKVSFELLRGNEPLSGGSVTTEYQLLYGYWLPGKFRSSDH